MDSCGARTMQLLADYGIETVFGIPGVHTVELYRGIAQSRIRHITPRHEQGAGFMADGYARATGKVGVCCLITGPGVTNAATALAQAYSDSVPVLAISSVNRLSSLGTQKGNLHQLRNQQKLTEQFTAFSHTIRSAEEVPAALERAFAVFDSARPRPVHIELPIDILGELVERDKPWLARRSVAPQPPASAIEQAARLIAQARAPVAIFGGGSVRAYLAARKLIDILGIPAVTTFAAKGVVRADHPLSIGSNLLHPPVLDFVQSADVVLAIGTELSETDIWSRGGKIKFDGRLIRVDIDADQINVNAPSDFPIIGDASSALEALIDALMREPASYAWDPLCNRERVQSLKSQCRRHWYKNTPRHRIVWNAIREALPEFGIVAADSTQIVYSGNYCYETLLPRTYLTSTTGYGTLGFALPAAIGAKIACPDTPVVCVAGDGGFQFTIQELATACEHRLPIVIVLWNNQAYGEIRDTFDDLGIERVGVELPSPNFVEVAKGYGADAQRVTSVQQFKSEIKRGLDAKRPTLLELCAEAFLSAD